MKYHDGSKIRCTVVNSVPIALHNHLQIGHTTNHHIHLIPIIFKPLSVPNLIKHGRSYFTITSGRRSPSATAGVVVEAP